MELIEEIFPENQLADQEVAEIMDKPPVIKKRKSDEPKGVSILEFLEDHYEENYPLYQFLKKMISGMLLCIRKKIHVDLVREIKAALQAVQRYVTRIGQSGKAYTIEAFCSLLREAKLYTMFTKDCMTGPIYCELVEFIEDNMEELSTSCVNTTDTTTSCTTVATDETAVDAPVYNLGASSSGSNALDALFEQQLSPQNIGKISQTISKTVNGKLYTWKSPGESGFQVIRLDVYDFKNVIDKVGLNLIRYTITLSTLYAITSRGISSQSVISITFVYSLG